jgi:hypothetical protein
MKRGLFQSSASMGLVLRHAGLKFVAVVVRAGQVTTMRQGREAE